MSSSCGRTYASTCGQNRNGSSSGSSSSSARKQHTQTVLTNRSTLVLHAKQATTFFSSFSFVFYHCGTPRCHRIYLLLRFARLRQMREWRERERDVSFTVARTQQQGEKRGVDCVERSLSVVSSNPCVCACGTCCCCCCCFGTEARVRVHIFVFMFSSRQIASGAFCLPVLCARAFVSVLV